MITHDFFEAGTFIAIGAHELTGRRACTIFASGRIVMGLVAGDNDTLISALRS